MNSPRVWWNLKLVISFGMLYYIFTHVPLGEVARLLFQVDIYHLLLGMATVPLISLANAVQQKRLTDCQDMRLSLLQIAEIGLITSFYGLFLPGYLAGGVIRWHRLARIANKPAEALATITFSRLLDTTVIVALGIVCWLIARPAGSNAMLTPLLLMAWTGLLGLQAIVFNRKAALWFCATLEHPRLRAAPPVLRGKIAKVLTSAGEFGGLSWFALGYIFSLGLVQHLLGTLSLAWLALALGIDLHFAALGWIRSFMMIALLLPISFAGLGVREGSLIVLLQWYGVSPVAAVSLSLLILASDLFRAAAGGLLEARRTLVPPQS